MTDPPSPPPPAWMMALPAIDRAVLVAALTVAIQARRKMAEDVALVQMDAAMAGMADAGEALSSFRSQADGARRLADGYLEIADALERVAVMLEGHAKEDQ